jgi:hypothetical protein
MLPNVREAKLVQDAINSIVPDVKLFYDHASERWAVCQIIKNAGGLILPTRDGLSTTRPTIMFRCQTADGSYRAPAEQDVSDVVALRRNADHAFKMGGDWVADQMEAREASKEQTFKQKQKEMIADIAKPLKRAIKAELA